jgi:hypothetical protein
MPIGSDRVFMEQSANFFILLYFYLNANFNEIISKYHLRRAILFLLTLASHLLMWYILHCFYVDRQLNMVTLKFEFTNRL